MNLELFCSKTGISKSEMIGRSRKSKIAIHRQVYCYLMRINTEETLQSIGASINRHHATVIYNIKTIRTFLNMKYCDIVSLVNLFEESNDPVS